MIPMGLQKLKIIQTTGIYQNNSSSNENNPTHHHTTTIIDTTDMLPKSPKNGTGNGQTTISCNGQNENGNLVKTHEGLYKEVEGFVASYDPVTSAGSVSQLAGSIPSIAAHTDDKP